MSDEVKAVFLDLSGVLYDGDKRIEDALEAVESFREQNRILRFVTNTATKSSEEILKKLRTLGFELNDDELMTAPQTAQAYVEARKLRPFALVSESIRPLFASPSDEEPDCVILGDAREGLTYGALNCAFRLCRKGAPLIVIGYNRYFKKDDALWLDAGAFAKAIEWAAGCEALIAGKPSREFFNQVVATTGLDAANCLMVGDDLQGDVVGGLNAGLQACLVRTGKYEETDAANKPEDALLIDSIGELPGLRASREPTQRSSFAD